MKCFKIIACATLSMVMLAAGCSSSGSGPAASSTPGYRAVVASGGNGGPTVFLFPTGSEKSTAIAPAGKAICEGCRTEADRYFQAGQMATNCSLCNAMLAAAQQQQ